MALGKQAKVLTEKQINIALKMLEDSRHPKRDRLMFLLSVKAGLRAKEIASVTWKMVTDAEGNITNHIRLENSASKGKSGRIVPMHKLVREAFIDYKKHLDKNQIKKVEPSDQVIVSERGESMLPGSVVHWFCRLYKNLGFDGCSSHSGRRTAITNMAKKASLAGASLKDVQKIAGHTKLSTTELYIQEDSEAQFRLMNLT